jgi:hypothetical protein
LMIWLFGPMACLTWLRDYGKRAAKERGSEAGCLAFF